jgi:hypothetical protein
MKFFKLAAITLTVSLVCSTNLISQDCGFSTIEGEPFTFGVEVQAVPSSFGKIYQGILRKAAPAKSKSDLLYESDFKQPTKAKVTKEVVNNYRVIITETCERLYLANGTNLFKKKDTKSPMNARIGMSRAELYEVAGIPTRINTTKSAYGVEEQLVYEREGSVTFIYVSDNKVKTIQIRE